MNLHNIYFLLNQLSYFLPRLHHLTQLTFPNTITYDGNNHFILSGYFHSKSVKFDSFEIFRTPSKDPIPWYGDIFVVKFTLDGKVVWANSVNGNSNKSAFGAWSDGNSNTYLFGTSSSDTLIIGQTRISLKGAKGYSDAFYCKYDSNGELLYAKTYDDGIAGGIDDISASVLPNGEFYIIGTFDSTVTKVDNITLPYFGNVTDLYILKYNKDGECLMKKALEEQSQKLKNQSRITTSVIPIFTKKNIRKV